MNNITPAPDYVAPTRRTKTLYNKDAEMDRIDGAVTQLAALTAVVNALIAEINTARSAKTTKSKTSND